MSMTYTYTVSDDEDAAITARRLATTPKVADNAAFVAMTIRETILGPVVAAFIESRVSVIADKYRLASAKERAAAESALEKVATPAPKTADPTPSPTVP